MYIRMKDLVILHANKNSLELGLKCPWLLDFIKSEYVSAGDKEETVKYPDSIRLTFTSEVLFVRPVSIVNLPSGKMIKKSKQLGLFGICIESG